MSAPRIVTFRMDSEKVTELDSLARTMDRDRSYLINEAVESYLSRQRRFVEMVEEGLRASEMGALIDDEEMGAKIESWIDSGIRKAPAAKRKARARA